MEHEITIEEGRSKKQLLHRAICSCGKYEGGWLNVSADITQQLAEQYHVVRANIFESTKEMVIKIMLDAGKVDAALDILETKFDQRRLDSSYE